jgi:hypothetical protein
VMCPVTRIRRRLRHLPQLRRLLRNSGELFRCRRSSLAEGEHIIAFVSSFPFRFAVPVHVSWSFPSNPVYAPFLCLDLVWYTVRVHPVRASKAALPSRLPARVLVLCSSPFRSEPQPSARPPPPPCDRNGQERAAATCSPSRTQGRKKR